MSSVEPIQVPIEDGIPPPPTDGRTHRDALTPLSIDPLVAASWAKPVQYAPVGVSIKKLAQRYTMDALGCLVEVVHDKSAPAPARVAAASQLLDRAYGKPKQYVDVEGEVVNLTLADLLARRMTTINGSEEPEAQVEPKEKETVSAG